MNLNQILNSQLFQIEELVDQGILIDMQLLIASVGIEMSLFSNNLHIYKRQKGEYSNEPLRTRAQLLRVRIQVHRGTYFKYISLNCNDCKLIQECINNLLMKTL